MTVLHIEVRDEARDDLANHYLYLAREAGTDVAEDMTHNVEQAFAQLRDHAGLGSPVIMTLRKLRGLRKWRVPRFSNLLIFYRSDGETLFVVRVLHASQDWGTHLRG